MSCLLYLRLQQYFIDTKRALSHFYISAVDGCQESTAAKGGPVSLVFSAWPMSYLLYLRLQQYFIDTKRALSHFYISAVDGCQGSTAAKGGPVVPMIRRMLLRRRLGISCI
jgi:hypothetical protein